MQKIYLLSCFTKKLKKKNYEAGQDLVLPFSGIYKGEQVKTVRLRISDDFVRPLDKIICICNLNVIGVTDQEILGTLTSIKFL